MEKHIIIAVVLRFVTDVMLMLAVNGLNAFAGSIWRVLLGAAVGGVYAAVCSVPGLELLGSPLGYGLCILLTGLLAFGFQGCALRQGAVFGLLRLGLDGIGAGKNSVLQLVCAGLLCIVCLYGFGSAVRQYVPVELHYSGKQLQLQALYDTGHQLRDPVTGRPVLVVGADVADALTGLTAGQLKAPVETMGKVPGLRLIPYQTVGQSGGLMLAMCLPDTRIGKKKGSYLVAFAPQVLDGKGKYQALIGGSV